MTGIIDVAVPDDRALAALADEVAELLCERRLMLVTAESCTGGWIAKCCTDLAGSSNWFERGFVVTPRSRRQQAGLRGPGMKFEPAIHAPLWTGRKPRPVPL